MRKRNTRYCPMCETYCNTLECKACGMDTDKAPAEVECLRCEGDGFAATGGGNCEVCHGGGRVTK